MMRLWRRRRGLTVPEVVTVASLFVLLVGGLIAMGSTAVQEWSQGSSQIMADSDASVAIQSLSSDARVGLRAYLGANSSELYVVLPVVNAQGDYNRFVEGRHVRYYLNGSTLYRQPAGDTARVLARRVAAVSFAVDGPRIGLTLTSRQRNGAHAKETVLNTQVTLRNEPPT